MGAMRVQNIIKESVKSATLQMGALGIIMRTVFRRNVLIKNRRDFFPSTHKNQNFNC